MNVLVYPNFISAGVCAELNAWVNEGVSKKWLDKGVDRGVDRSNHEYEKRFTSRLYSDRFEYPQVAYTVFNKISDYLGLQDAPKSVAGGGKDGMVVSCTFNGGDVYSHIDPKEPFGEVLRCNIMTTDTEKGGQLYVGGSHIQIQAGDLHCYLASSEQHYVTTVEGDTPRILWMFGYQVTANRFKQIQVA